MSEVLQAVSRASKRCSAGVHQEMSAGVFSLATIACIAPWVGIYGTILGIVNSFQGISGSRVTIMAAIAKGLSQSLWPTALGLSVGLMSLWFYRHLTDGLLTFDLEMENASLELMNQLARFPKPFHIAPAIDCVGDGRMFGEVPLDEVRRDEKFEIRCLFLAGTALVLAWFAQLSRYLLVDLLSLWSSAGAACLFIPIVFAISCLPAYLVWGKLLRRRPGGLMALGSVICLCWSVAELWLGRALP